MKKFSFIIMIFCVSSITFALPQNEFEIIRSKSTLDSQNLLLNINTASESEFLKYGIPKGQAEKIIEYREITGGFGKLNEMTRISGIGKATYEKLKVKFKEPEYVRLKKFNINKADDKVLKYYGFTGKEIGDIKKYREKNIFRNNLELKKVISAKKYDDLKDYIEY